MKTEMFPISVTASGVTAKDEITFQFRQQTKREGVIPRYNIPPNTLAAIILRDAAGQMQITEARWGAWRPA